MLALDPQWLRAAKSDPSIIRGVAGLAGPYDFLPLEKGGRAEKAMGKVRPIERTQPIHFVRGDAPPLWPARGDEAAGVLPRHRQKPTAAAEKGGGGAGSEEPRGGDRVGRQGSTWVGAGRKKKK